MKFQGTESWVECGVTNCYVLCGACQRRVRKYTVEVQHYWIAMFCAWTACSISMSSCECMKEVV